MAFNQSLNAHNNSPAWNSRRKKTRGFYETWFFKINHESEPKALWIRFTILISSNGFQRKAEMWGVYFERLDSGEMKKTALKKTFDIGDFSFDGNCLNIGNCIFCDTISKGEINSKGQTITWNMDISNAKSASFNFIPKTLLQPMGIKNEIFTVSEDLFFSGTTEINGQRTVWNMSKGMQSHSYGTKNPFSWVWAHCNKFIDADHNQVPFVFEGSNFKLPLAGPVKGPRLSSFFFLYKDRKFEFNSIWNIFRIRSNHTLTEWNFRADKGEYSFRGGIKANLKDFAGITYEDTNGTLMYCANSKLSNMTISIYRREKLENHFIAKGTAAFELVSREKNPYVAMLI